MNEKHPEAYLAETPRRGPFFAGMSATRNVMTDED
jgi:hypothetical protein